MKYNEDDIKSKIKNHKVDIDTNELWSQVKPFAPIGSKKYVFPFWPFLFGFVIGAAGIYLLLAPKPCIINETPLFSIIDSLNNKITMLEHDNQGYQNTDVKLQGIIRSLSHELNTKIKPTQYNTRKDLENHMPIIPNGIASLAPINKSLINTNERPVEQVAFIDIKQIGPFPQHEELVDFDQKIKVTTNANSYPVSKIFGANWAMPYVSNSSIDIEGQQKNVNFGAESSFAIDLGLMKNASRRWAYGGFLNYSNSNYSLNYRSITNESINLVDTSEIHIDPYGNSTPVIGNVGAQKIVETSGKVYGKDHRIAIIPTLALTSVNKEKWSIIHHIGLGLDVWTQYKRIHPRIDDQAFDLERNTFFYLNPFLRLGSSINYSFNQKSSFSLNLQVTYRKDTSRFQNQKMSQTEITPSLGIYFNY